MKSSFEEDIVSATENITLDHINNGTLPKSAFKKGNEAAKTGMTEAGKKSLTIGKCSTRAVARVLGTTSYSIERHKT